MANSAGLDRWRDAMREGRLVAQPRTTHADTHAFNLWEMLLTGNVRSQWAVAVRIAAKPDIAWIVRYVCRPLGGPGDILLPFRRVASCSGEVPSFGRGPTPFFPYLIAHSPRAQAARPKVRSPCTCSLLNKDQGCRRHSKRHLVLDCVVFLGAYLR